jgi:hypothetical protein
MESLSQVAQGLLLTSLLSKGNATSVNGTSLLKSEFSERPRRGIVSRMLSI